MDPQQELFSYLLEELKKKYPESVYDTFLPPKSTPYPFIYLADSNQIDDANKSAVFGNVSQTIHVWHNNPRQRGIVSEMLLGIKRICYKLQNTKNFSWMVINMNQRILPDTTVKPPLMHGMLEVEFKFS